MAPPFAPVAADLNRLESMLTSSIESDGEAGASAAALLAAGGKRIRPALVLLSARLGHDYDFDRIAPAALGVELTHAATLIHDDVIDRSPTRRGQQTVWARDGEATAIVVADFYFSKGYREVSRTGRPELVTLLAETVMQLCAGELRQQAARYRYSVGVDEYLRRIELKTARLLGLSCTLGAILGGLDESGESAMSSYGLSLGMAFQIADDVLDYTSAESALGKPVAHDLAEGHATLPLLLAMHDFQAANELKTLVREGEPVAEARLPRIVEIVRASGAIDAALSEASKYADVARQSLRRFPDSPARQALAELANYVVTRNV